MRDPAPHPEATEGEHSVSLRDLVAPLFRQRRTVWVCFVVVTAAAVVAAALWPREYEARMKILVERGRLDPVVTGEARAAVVVRVEVSEEQLRSEMELLRSRDLLERVAGSCGVNAGGGRTAAEKLEQKLSVDPLKRTNLILVKYRARYAGESECVLDRMAEFYLEKHLGVHRASGAFAFFTAQAERFRQRMQAAEDDLRAFGEREGVVAAEMERDITLRKLADFESELAETQAGAAAAGARIRSLDAQLGATPERRTAAVKTADNAFLLEEYKKTLLGLELKRTELLSKFEPAYRPVVEVEEQIRQTRAAITAAEATPIREQTTDRDPTNEWLRTELARARAERALLESRARETARVVTAYRAAAQRLDARGTTQQGLLRTAKEAEEHYLLYARKQEEARISDALDQQGIANVSVAEPAAKPEEPVGPGWAVILLLGLGVASVGSVGVALAADYFDVRVRTPDELAACAGLPVLAAVPREGR